MSRDLKAGITAGIIVAFSIVGFVITSIVISENHDALVRQQVVETCKEFR